MPLPWWDVEDLLDDPVVEPLADDRTFRSGVVRGRCGFCGFGVEY